MSEKTLKIWVYGTLKVGGKLSKAFDPYRKSVTPATTKGTMFSVGWYPGVKFDNSNILYGELHEYSNAGPVEASLDRIEGFRGKDNPANLYNKVKITVQVGDKEEECLAYEFNRSTHKLEEVLSGTWEV